jgi:hypothetical protein
MSIKCVTLRVREYANMISINNQQRDLEIHIDSHIFNEDHYRWTTMSGFINPVYEFLCLMIFYLSEIRSSVSPYLVQSHLQQVLFTRSESNIILWLNSLTTCLQTVYDIDYQVGSEYISPSREGKIPISIHATQQVLSDYLRDTFMITLS